MLDIAEQIACEIVSETLSSQQYSSTKNLKIDNIFSNSSSNFVNYCNYISSR